MKRFLLSLLAVGLLRLTGYSQTNAFTGIGLNTNTSPPTLTLGAGIDEAIAALTTATNWAVAPFLTLVKDAEADKTLWGGGVAGVYNLSEHAASIVRLDYLDGNLYLLGADLQLSLPFDTFSGNMRNTPFGFVGGAWKFSSGQGDERVIGVVGAGYDLKFPKLSKHWSVAFDAEYWSDRPGVQWRFTPFVWRF